MWNPAYHFWLADDGRVYASNRQIITTEADADYAAWVAAGNTATQWPRDDAGNQTNDAMQAVVGPHGQFVDLTYYTADARQRKMGSNLVVNGLPFATDPITYSSLNSAYIYTQAKTGDVFSWKLPDGTFVTLDKTDIAALHVAANSYGQSCYKCEDDTLAAIEAGTITDRAAIDAAFAAISNVFTGLSSDAQKVRHKHK